MESDARCIPYPWEELVDAKSPKTIPVFSYGSLVDPNSAKRSLRFSDVHRMSYAIATGVRRVFNYRMPQRFLNAWKVPDGSSETAALNLTITGRGLDRVNGAIIEVDTRDFEALLLREEGYDLVQVPLLPWGDDALSNPIAYAFVASQSTPHGARFVDNQVHPVEPYSKLCIDAAFRVSRQFGEYFCNTTFLNNGQSLAISMSPDCSAG